ncbi:MAG: large repetitive protein [Chloroflexota bacterium]|jgi:hypothetical protein|nr:large repetitive protein [Chloroflexota bacterium]
MRTPFVGILLALALVGCTTSTLDVQPGQLPGATVGQAYDVTITATSPEGVSNEKTALSLDSGELPPGLSLRQGNPTSGIEGTPTTAGTYPFKLRANGGACTMGGCVFGLRDYTLVVNP